MVGDLGRRGLLLVTRVQSVPSTSVVPVTLSGTFLTFETNPVPVNVTLSQDVAVSTLINKVTTFRLALVTPSLKIAENESPRPLDRVFGACNSFDNLQSIGAGAFDAHTATFGFEKTFLDGNASIEVRVPVIQTGNMPGTASPEDGPSSQGGDQNGFGASTVSLKYALVNDRGTGDVVSAGLALTGLTGKRVILGDGSSLETCYIQPYGGFIYNMGPAYVHGFSSVAFAPDSRDITFMSNDVGVGYRIYEASGPALLSRVTPTVEAHLFTPLNNRGQGALIQSFDDVVLTAGVNFALFGNRLLVTTAASRPLCGPRQYDMEWIAQVNFLY
jgi:hypothetical protein